MVGQAKTHGGGDGNDKGGALEGEHAVGSCRDKRRGREGGAEGTGRLNGHRLMSFSPASRNLKHSWPDCSVLTDSRAFGDKTRDLNVT